MVLLSVDPVGNIENGSRGLLLNRGQFFMQP